MSEESQMVVIPDDANSRLIELKRQLEAKDTQLRERDQTVQELTARLSQAVERLDRVQRVGTDRIVVSTAAFPKEVVEQQTELVDDLQRAVQMWENMQLGCGLGRLEMQLSDLQELIEEHFREPEPEPAPAESVVSVSSGDPAEDAPSEDIPSPDHSDDADSNPARESTATEVDEVCPLRPPEILNLTEATEADLRRCVDQQDKYIDYLSKRLQRAAENPKSVNWDELASKPQAIKSQLEHTLTKLQQSRHFAELEAALQFTRLRRKERELKHIADELSHRMQSMARMPEIEHGKDFASSRRWMRMLGMGKQESE